MNDPYSVLGIRPDASDDEVKRAYRQLARKYHPDNYQNNPLADLAEEKMKAINEAYDQICKQREGRAGGGSSAGGTYYTGRTEPNDSAYARIRSLIYAGDLEQAERLLNEIGDHTAQWYFLQGSVAFRKGWLDEATRNFQIACQMDPMNAEYRQALSMLQRSGQPGQTGGPSVGFCGQNNCCTTLLCLDCLTPGCGCC